MYLKVRSPHKAINEMTRKEKWGKRRLEVQHLRTFGCTTYVHKLHQTRNKLKSKNHKCIFVGYGHDSKTYHLFDVATQKPIISHDVVFNEHAVHPNHDTNTTNKDIKPTLAMETQLTKLVCIEDNGSNEDLGNFFPILNDLQSNTLVIAKDSTLHPPFINSQILVESEQVVNSRLPTKKSTRMVRTPHNLMDYAHVIAMDEPISFT